MNNYYKKQILIEGGYGDRDGVTKAQWLSIYEEYSKFEKRTVKVYDIDFEKDYFLMENIKGSPLSIEIIKHMKISEMFRIRHEIVDIANKMFIFDHVKISKDPSRIWFHGDMKLENFMITENGEIKLIDPDSFKLARMNAVIGSKITTALRDLDIAYYIKTEGPHNEN